MSRLSRRRIASYAATQLARGTKPKTIAAQLAAYLLGTKQADAVDSLLADIQYECALSHGVLFATVTTARPLGVAQKSSLQKNLKQHYGARQVELSEVIDPAVLGGMRVQTPDKTLDATTRFRLQALKRMTI